MSRGDINSFLKNLFQSEGGTNPKIVNQYGYIGKYQFGEDALIDLGYYKPDGTKNRTLTGKFKYDWAGDWTGKHGVTCRDDFLGSESVQDKAAKEWVKLLCSRTKRFKLQQYIGKTINNIPITESGIIAAAHLRGFGSGKSPGVRQFLATNGSVDPQDANGTPVSKYMRLFADYDLGCCGSITAVLIDKDKKPIVGLDYQIRVGSRVAAKGKTNAHGTTTKVEALDAGANITIFVKRLEGGFKEIKSFIAHEQTAFVATLRSATRMVTTHLEKHLGTAGDYKRHSEMTGQKKPASISSAKALKPEAVVPTASSPSQSRVQRPEQHPLTDSRTNNPAKANDSNASTASSSQSKILSQDEQATIAGANDSIAFSGGSGIETEKQDKIGFPSLEEDTKENGDGDGDTAPQPEQSPAAESKRNEDGHPVAVVKPDKAPSSKTDPGVQRLEEILRKNVLYGKKDETLSGPVAATKSRKGEVISVYRKREDSSLGRCYKYVKIALLASGMTKHYLGQEAAKNAGPELKKEGYRDLLDNQDHGMKSPYDAPEGAVIVYDVTDRTPWGHIEVRINGGFASDYFSERPRTSPRNEKRQDATMSGRNRKVSGIWVKE